MTPKEQESQEQKIAMLYVSKQDAEELLVETYKILARRQDTPPLAEAKAFIRTAAHSAVKNEDRFFKVSKVLENYNII